MMNESCSRFLAELASKAPTPGGGGTAALVGAAGVALGNMVGCLTVGKKKYAAVEADILTLNERAGALRGGIFQRRAGERLPPMARVGVGRALLHGQHRVQQQYPVLCPVGQLAVLAGVVDAHIVLDLLEDVHQRRRRSHAFPHGKAEPVSLIGVVIGILSQDHCPHLGIGGIFQGVENIIHAGINGLGAVFRQQKLPQVLVVGLGEFAV